MPAAYAGSAGPYGGGLGIGGGYPILPPAGPDPAGAREKLAFVGQAGNLGQNDTLAATVRDPISPYLVTAGDVIPCVAQGGEDSDTPGQFVGRVSRNIYDSATGRFLLIPQNSKVIGTYDNVVTNGQTRIPTVITRIIFPDSSSIPIGAMPAADQGGFAGLHDQVDTHLWEKFGNALILAIGSAGIQLSQGTGQSTNGYNAQQIGAAAIGQQFGELGTGICPVRACDPQHAENPQRLQLRGSGHEGHGASAVYGSPQRRCAACKSWTRASVRIRRIRTQQDTYCISQGSPRFATELTTIVAAITPSSFANARLVCFYRS